MFPQSTAQTQLRRSRHLSLLGFCLFGPGLCLDLSAQAGSVAFTLESFESVPENAVTADYPYFSALQVMPFTATNQAPIDYVLLQRFRSISEVDPVAIEEDEDYQAVTSIVAEYNAYHKSTDTYREAGLLSFTLAEDSNVGVTGDNIIGFVRQTAVPSTLPTEQNPGYLDGMTGTIEWNYSSGTRTVFASGSEALYAPSFDHEDYFTLTASGATAGVSGWNVPVAGAESLNWGFVIPALRPIVDRASQDEHHYFSLLNRFDTVTAEDLLLEDGDSGNDLVPESLGLPWEARNRLYVIRLQDLNDSDADGVPDFLDLTYALEVMPFYADSGGAKGWYFTKLLQDWVYSSRETDWDYTLKFGWIWTYPTPRSNFWFHAASPSLGWIWTKTGLFPWIYRAQDDTWLYWMGEEENGAARQSIFYNSVTGAFETLSF